VSGDKRVHSRVCVVTCNGGDLFIISKRARTLRRHQCHEHVTCACIYVCVFVTGGKKLRFERAFSARAPHILPRAYDVLHRHRERAHRRRASSPRGQGT
jgi:hypothetical protein